MNNDQKPCFEVAAGLVFHDGRLLITQRHAESHLGGLWEFPGGKRHPEETFEECLQRELMEELGITVDVRELVESIRHSYPEKTVDLRFFRCVWKAGKPERRDCADFHWASCEELDSFEFPAADARLLTLVRQSPALWR